MMTDTCMTSLFSTTFICRLCGREVCNDCFQQVRELTEEPANASEAELAAFASRREKHAHSNPFFLSCLKRNDHSARDFTPVTRFVPAELMRATEEMEKILKQDEQEDSSIGSLASPANRHENHMPTTLLVYSQVTANPSVPFPNPYTQPVSDDFLPSNLPLHITSIPVYRAQVIPASYFDLLSPQDPRPPSFSGLWQKGLPLLVKDVLPRFKLNWNPQYFMDKYGQQSCLIVECQTDANKKVSIREFFDSFGKYEGRQDCWKLKVCIALLSLDFVY